MTNKDKKKNEWWDRFDKWEEEWKKKRKEERMEDAKKLRQAEEDYDRSLHSLNPLTTTPQPKEILATQSREPGSKRIPLEDPLNCPLILPVRIIKIEQPDPGEAIVFFQAKSIDKGENFLEQLAFQIKKVIEYLVNERLLFFVQPAEKGAFVIRVAGDKKAPPLFNISGYSGEAILIKALEKSLQWSPGYIFNVRDILKGILKRLLREFEDQKED
ncbi:MAG: hypothetical protein ACMUIU_14595 [bacterium]